MHSQIPPVIVLSPSVIESLVRLLRNYLFSPVSNGKLLQLVEHMVLRFVFQKKFFSSKKGVRETNEKATAGF